MGRLVPLVAKGPEDDDVPRPQPSGSAPPGDAADRGPAGRADGSDGAIAAPVPLTVAAVAARLGVAPSTLRTWDRRYGLGPSGRTAGAHRRYTAEDVARLEAMRHLTLAGVAPSDAARIAADQVPGSIPAMPLPPVTREPGAPGSKVDALTVAAAAIDGDEHRLKRLVFAAVRGWGLAAAWTEVLQPALGYLARRAVVDRPGRDPDHLLAGAVLALVRGIAEPVSGDRRSVVICADPALVVDRLGAHVLAGALADRGVNAVVRLGPIDAGQALRAVDVPGLVVVAVLGNAPEGEALARAACDQDGVLVILVGPDAPAVWLPEIQRVRTFAGAVHEIVGALAPQEGSGPPPLGT